MILAKGLISTACFRSCTFQVHEDLFLTSKLKIGAVCVCVMQTISNPTVSLPAKACLIKRTRKTIKVRRFGHGWNSATIQWRLGSYCCFYPSISWLCFKKVRANFMDVILRAPVKIF